MQRARATLLRGEKRGEKSAMLKRGEPEFTDGVRYRPRTAS